jgi:phosphatidylinositol glycan class N
LQTYDWLFLRALITVGYLGWIAYAATTVIDLHVLHGAVSDDRTIGTTMAFSSILVLMYSFFIIERSPVTYYAYALFPVFFWEEIFARRKAFVSGFGVLFDHVHGVSAISLLFIQTIIYMIVIEGLVSSGPKSGIVSIF